MKAVLNGKMVVGMLRDFGLSEYEARVYFVFELKCKRKLKKLRL